MRVGRCEAEQDLYKILGVSPSASAGEIRRAHKKLVKLHHPDLTSLEGDTQRQAEARMKEINHAASLLLDERSRQHYDALRGRPARRKAPPPAPPAWYEAPPSPPRAAAAQPTEPDPFHVDLAGHMASISGWLQANARASSLLALALAATVLCALIAPMFGGPVPVSSPDYKVPRPPQRVTMWAP